MAEKIMSDKTGGQAFPCPGMITPNGDLFWPEPGMTMRQYYAATALHGELASQGIDFLVTEARFESVAQRCFQIADAMIAVENKQATLGVKA